MTHSRPRCAAERIDESVTALSGCVRSRMPPFDYRPTHADETVYRDRLGSFMTTALDVGIGLVFMYLLLALLVSTVQELIASVLSLRAKQLYAAIEGMLTHGVSAVQRAEQSSLVQQFYRNPLVANLAQREFKVASTKLLALGDGLPSYIPSKTFALALVQVLKGELASETSGAADAVGTARQLVDKIENGRLKQTLQIFVGEIERLEQNSDKQIQLLSSRIEDWFNDRMARAAGWYKRKSQAIALFLALALSAACNASTTHVACALWTNASLRVAVVASAQAHDQAAASDLTSSSLPIGWHSGTPCGCDFLYTALGWLMTAVAVSLGAGFWFDALSKLLKVRGAGPRVSPTTGKSEE